MHTYNDVCFYNFNFRSYLCFFVKLNFLFYFVVKVKLFVLLFCVLKTVCVFFAWKDHPQNDLYCVGWDVKHYSLTSSISEIFTLKVEMSPKLSQI